MTIQNHLTEVFFNLSEKKRFFIIGVYNTAFAIALYAVLFFLFNSLIDYLILLVVTHFISVTNSFYFMKHFVYQSKNENVFIEFIKCNLMYLVILVFNGFFTYLFAEKLLLHPIISFTSAVGLLTIISYYGQKKFTFTSPSDRASSKAK